MPKQKKSLATPGASIHGTLLRNALLTLRMMIKTNMGLSELLAKQDGGDFLHAVAEAVLQLIMEADVEGLIGADKYEQADQRTTWRNGYL